MKWFVAAMLMFGVGFGVGSLVGLHYQQSLFQQCFKYYAELEFATPDDKQVMADTLHQLEGCMTEEQLDEYKAKLGYK